MLTVLDVLEAFFTFDTISNNLLSYFKCEPYLSLLVNQYEDIIVGARENNL